MAEKEARGGGLTLWQPEPLGWNTFSGLSGFGRNGFYERPRKKDAVLGT